MAGVPKCRNGRTLSVIGGFMRYKMSLLHVDSSGEITDMETAGYDVVLEGTKIECRENYIQFLDTRGVRVVPDRITATLLEDV